MKKITLLIVLFLINCFVFGQTYHTQHTDASHLTFSPPFYNSTNYQFNYLYEQNTLWRVNASDNTKVSILTASSLPNFSNIVVNNTNLGAGTHNFGIIKSSAASSTSTFENYYYSGSYISADFFSFASTRIISVSKKSETEFYFLDDINKTIFLYNITSKTKSLITDYPNTSDISKILYVSDYDAMFTVRNNSITRSNLTTGIGGTLVASLPGVVSSLSYNNGYVFYSIEGDAQSGGGIYRVNLNTFEAPVKFWEPNSADNLVGSISSISFNRKDYNSLTKLFVSFYGTNKAYISFDNSELLRSNKFDLSDQISVYPNPVNDILNVNVSDNLEIAKIEILALDGRTVQDFTTSTFVNLEHLLSGIYLVKITSTEGKIGMQRIIKK